MQLSTIARDCLYLNWALPRPAAPRLPRSLRYEVHSWEGQEWVFVSALLFRLSELRTEILPAVRLAYPQMSVRLYVLDQDGLPAMLVVRTLVPAWVAPLSRLLARQPAEGASFSYPSPSYPAPSYPGPAARGAAEPHGQDGTEPGDGRSEWDWTWRVWQRGGGQRRELRLKARIASPRLGPGPSLGPWDKAVDYFRHRRRGYALDRRRLRTLRTSQTPAGVWPLDAEIECADLLAERFKRVDPQIWPRFHSAWLCPEIPFTFELGKPIRIPMPSSSALPAPEGI